MAARGTRLWPRVRWGEDHQRGTSGDLFMRLMKSTGPSDPLAGDREARPPKAGPVGVIGGLLGVRFNRKHGFRMGASE